MSIVYALLYMLFTIYPIGEYPGNPPRSIATDSFVVFQEMRGWNAGVGALPLIGTMLGAFVAGAIVFYESTISKKKMLAGIERTPEDRMPLAMIGGILFPISMFWFAWSGNFNSCPWPVVAIVGHR